MKILTLLSKLPLRVHSPVAFSQHFLELPHIFWDGRGRKERGKGQRKKEGKREGREKRREEGTEERETDLVC